MIEQVPTSIRISGPEGIIVHVIPTSVSEQFSNTGVHEVHIDWSSSDGSLTGTVVTTPLHLTETLDKEGFFEPASLFKHYPNQLKAGGPWWLPDNAEPPPPTADLSQIEADLAKLPTVTPEDWNGPAASGWADASPLQTMYESLTALKKINKTFTQHMTPAMQETAKQMHVFAAKGEVFLNHETAPIGKVVGTKLTPGGLEIEVKVPDLSDGGAVIPKSLEAKFAEVWGVPFDMITTDEAPKKPQPKQSPEANAEDVMKDATLEAVETLWVGLHDHSWPDKLNTLNGVDTLQLDDGTTLEVLLTVKPKEVKP